MKSKTIKLKIGEDTWQNITALQKRVHTDSFDNLLVIALATLECALDDGFLKHPLECSKPHGRLNIDLDQIEKSLEQDGQSDRQLVTNKDAQ